MAMRPMTTAARAKPVGLTFLPWNTTRGRKVDTPRKATWAPVERHTDNSARSSAFSEITDAIEP